jgi:hypothetical protein
MSDGGWGTNSRTISTKLLGVFNQEKTYHYRIVVMNDAGTVYGEDKTFKTKDYFAASTQWTSWPFNGLTLDFADVNGDGKADSVGWRNDEREGNTERVVSLSTGSSFAAPSSWGSWVNGFSFALADVNGDGKADSVGRNSAGEVRVGLSTGTAFAAPSKWGTLSTAYAIVFRDVNGDGKADILGGHSSNGDRLVALSTGSSFAAPSSWGVWSYRLRL